jgi:Spy/CpxP family protein refolding chaperone
MKNYKSILLLVLVFLAGTVTGVVGTRAVLRHIVHQAILHPDRAQAFMERSLARRLQLDTEQQAKLHQIFMDAHARLKDLRHEYQPQFFEVLSNADGQITALLTPEQQAKFEQLKAKNHPLWQAMQPDR